MKYVIEGRAWGFDKGLGKRAAVAARISASHCRGWRHAGTNMGEAMETGFSRGDASVLLSTLSLLVGVSLTIIGTVVLVMYVEPRGGDRGARHPWRNAFVTIFLVDLAVNFYLIFLMYWNTLGHLTILELTIVVCVSGLGVIVSVIVLSWAGIKTRPFRHPHEAASKPPPG